ncbi:hypothetical protein KIW84_014334 [Lathyrus oleraceus]|uniref:Retrotransposon gag protein n=1 Tax=Pisum sativum TaxID=3888 RepID=A0A9D5GZ28_PEA|nr:hypothetical protein KIW84_014334 [Pisum sativum]
MDGQIERIIQSFEDLLRAFVLEQGGTWGSYLSLIEFTYNNIFYSSIRMDHMRRCTLRRYISDPSHVIQVDDVQVEDNLIVGVSPMRIEDREVKQIHGKEIALVKVVWGGPAGRSMTWEREKQLRESYPTLFSSCNFRG